VNNEAAPSEILLGEITQDVFSDMNHWSTTQDSMHAEQACLAIPLPIRQSMGPQAALESLPVKPCRMIAA